MKVRFRFEQGPRVSRRHGKNRRLAAAIGALLIPMALMAFVLGLWKLASDLGVAGEFEITGVFSHWQVWIALGFALSFAASVLNRYGRGGQLDEARVATPFPFEKPGVEPPDAKLAGPHLRRKSGS